LLIGVSTLPTGVPTEKVLPLEGYEKLGFLSLTVMLKVVEALLPVVLIPVIVNLAATGISVVDVSLVADPLI
jgi:hypothetical protein